MGTRQLYPSEIRFSSDSIPSKFEDGKDVNEVAEDICQGKITAGDIPIIQIVKRDGKYYTLSNRRLYVFRVGQFKKRIGKIPVLLFNEDLLHPEKHTTTNDGRFLFVQDETTLPHIKDSWLKSAQTNDKPQIAAVNGKHAVSSVNGNCKATEEVVVDMPDSNDDDTFSPSSWWACSIL